MGSGDKGSQPSWLLIFNPFDFQGKKERKPQDLNIQSSDSQLIAPKKEAVWGSLQERDVKSEVSLSIASDLETTL